MPEVESDWKPVAFKEWQVVCDAIAEGGQSVILRKGGISEGKHGFQWIHDRFFLFPTLFHEQGQHVRPGEDGSQRTFEECDEHDREIPFSVYVETIATGRLTDWEEICALEPYHIWTRDCIRERYDWGDEPGISYAVVRAAVLTEPWILPDRKGFGGCRSWIGLPESENGGFREKLAPADWVTPTCGVPELI
ncbi:MAG: DUF1802 family protein [Verrucomicrobiales bacterium]|nr:DUF1802 family protein [Verrucomicrobiales bacterium]